MLDYTALYCNVLHCTVLYCTVLCYKYAAPYPPTNAEFVALAGWATLKANMQHSSNIANDKGEV